MHKQLLKFINREHNREVAIQVFLDLHLPGYIKRGVANTHYLNGKLPELVGGLPLLFYAGNISENRKLFDGYEINTQDRPLFEYRAPRNIGHQVGNKNLYLGGAELSMRYDALLAELPPRRDPYLKNLSDKQFKFIEAGLSYYKHSVSLHQVWLTRDPDSLKEAKSHYREFQQKTEIILSP